LFKGRSNGERILRNSDDRLRVAGSLKCGRVTVSLLIDKFQSNSRKNWLARALQDYCRLVKMIFILRYLERKDHRRRIHAELNNGEALQGLRQSLLFANKGVLRDTQEGELMDQASCLNLATNSVVI
jgi:TnpA family transposase